MTENIEDKTMTENLNKNRRLKRWNLIKSLRVLEQETDIFVGHLSDINTEGMMMRSVNPIPIGKNFQLYIEIITEKINVEVCSRWSKKDEESNTYKTGFQFVNSDSKNLTNINCLIKALEISCSESDLKDSF